MDGCHFFSVAKQASVHFEIISHLKISGNKLHKFNKYDHTQTVYMQFVLQCVMLAKYTVAAYLQ